MLSKSKTNRTQTLLAMCTALMLVLLAPLFAREAEAAVAYTEADYALVYNYNYYTTRYPYLRESGKTRREIFNRFVMVGMKNGARASANFNPARYRANYPDLQKEFGNNWPKYYQHYIEEGHKEGRLAVADVTTYKFKLKIDPNGGIYRGSSEPTYRYRTYGTKMTLPDPVREGYEFTGWKLTGTGKLNGSRFTVTRTTLGTTTLTAQWERKESLAPVSGSVKEKIENMVQFALSKVGTGGSETWKYWGFEEEWCCMFMTYCADKGGGLIDPNVYEDQWGSGHLPKCAGQRELASLLQAKGQLVFASSGYIPQRGNLIFFSKSGRTTNTSSFSHIGIVTGYSDGTVYTVEGNTGTYNRYTSYVKEKSYDLDAERICAYGIIR